jgi:hypothetical protein
MSRSYIHALPPPRLHRCIVGLLLLTVLSSCRVCLNRRLLDNPELATFPLSSQTTVLIGSVMHRHAGLERDNREIRFVGFINTASLF